MTELDWTALADHLREIDKGRRLRVEPDADASLVDIPVEQVLTARIRASHLHARLPAGAHREAAYGGLQDSAPRDATMALHARMAGVGPATWEHLDLVQIWFRWADYVVPRVDVDVFTLGAMPRDPRIARSIEAFGRVVADRLEEGEVRPDVIARELAGIPRPMWIRAASVSGLFHIRWDTRTVTLRRASPPQMDVEDARLELARRHLRWLGPSNDNRFAKWAGISREDAAATWAALRRELELVRVRGKARAVLATDIDTFVTDEGIRGVRLLPMGDPFLQPDPLVAARPVTLDHVQAPRKLVNSLYGRILADGGLVGAWGRRQERVTVTLSPGCTVDRDRVEQAALALESPVGKPIKLAWV